MHCSGSPVARTGVALAAIVLFASGIAHAATREEVRGQLADSLDKWAQAKSDCGGNYEYLIRFSSWSGFGHETTIVVRDNKVTERRYRSWSGQPRPVAPGEAPKPDGESWTEKGDKLGSHDKGAPLKTLDDLYVDAAKALETDTDAEAARYYFKANEAGVMIYCFWVDTRIADDAPRHGVALASLKLEPPKQN